MKNESQPDIEGSKNMKQLLPGKWKLEGGKLVEIEEEKQENAEPSIEISEDYQQAVENKEKSKSVMNEFKIEEVSNANHHAVLMDDLLTTRTNETYSAHLEKMFQAGGGIPPEGVSRNDQELEANRIKKATQLNDAILNRENRISATTLAKDYFNYVKDTLDIRGSETEVVAKTLETMEAEEQELATKVAKQEATEEEVKRMAQLADAKKILKRLSK